MSGLELNFSKCEITFIGSYSQDIFNQVAELLPGIRLTGRDDLELLGAPIYCECIDKAINKRKEELSRMTERLSTIDTQSAVLLYRHSVGAPRSKYLLRAAPCYLREEALKVFDELQRAALEKILNVILSPSKWDQASLPMNKGGFGIRKLNDITLPAYISSTTRTRSLIAAIIPSSIDVHDLSVSSSMSLLLSKVNFNGEMEMSTQSCQSKLDGLMSDISLNNLLDNADTPERARLLAASHKDSSRWMHAIPSSNLGTKVDDATTRIAISLRLGARVVVPHECKCGKRVNELGRHALSSERSAGRQHRHSQINDIISRSLTSASIPNMREVTGISRDDNRRPDGVTLIPYSEGRALVWDATVTDLFAASNVASSSVSAGSVADSAEVRKINKYTNLSSDYKFVPIAFDTFGIAGQETRSFLKELSKRLIQSTKEKRAGHFMMQRISLEIIRGNSISVMGSFVTKDGQLRELEYIYN
jgi:hypothetical protein